ncbi:MAG: hypothetical protein V2B18_24655, partial [Pseudomonadota bacterium]
IHEIRFGTYKGKARMVVDYQNNTVPPFEVKKEGDTFIVALGGAASEPVTKGGADAKTSAAIKPAPPSHLAPSFVPATANPGTGRKVELPPVIGSGKEAAAEKEKSIDVSVSSATKDSSKAKPMQLAQAMDLEGPPPPGPGKNQGPPRERKPEPKIAPAPKAVDRPERDRPAPSVSSQGAAGGAREVRPPVTPPTPDPRLVVQEITELKFMQVGHNSRLMVRGGDHLDYRMTKESPTKVRLDLINAEIPKAYQKPLQTDLFSTSVEMIVPGSQTLFIQLKDAVPYQVQKQKGVLMVDFPPPRFALTDDMRVSGKAEEGDQASQAVGEQKKKQREEKKDEARVRRRYQLDQQLESLSRKERELEQKKAEAEKERKEIEKKYPIITPDPDVFSKPVTMDFQGIALKNAFRLLAEQAGINIIVGDDVKGATTVRLFQVPLGQVIDHLLNTNGLDRDVLGNVMWVGTSKSIKDRKDTRKKQRDDLLNYVDKKLNAIRAELRQLEARREALLKEVAEEESVGEAVPEDMPNFQPIGASTVVKIGDQLMTFIKVRIKLNYAKPGDILPILECMFRFNCKQKQPTAEEAVGQKRQQAEESAAQQGFSPDSPGGQDRVERDMANYDRERRTRTLERQVTQTPGRQVAEEGGEGDLDDTMRRIIAHTNLWSNDKYNMIFIQDLPERIEEMKKLIATLDVPTPQVLIEGRIVLATRSWGRGLGVLWGGRNNQIGNLPGPDTAAARRQGIWGYAGQSGTAGSPTGTTIGPGDITSGFVVNLPATIAGGVNPMSMGIQFGLLASQFATDLDLSLQLGESSGQTKTIGRPKVQVEDGKRAEIKNGEDIPYATVSAAGSQIQLVSAALGLSVTPKIYPDGRIEMQINITDNAPGNTYPGGVGILKREAKTVLIVKDGETAVIGGILRQSDTNSRGGWPGLMNVPIVNFFFSNKNVSKGVAELLVFITPSIIKRPPLAS